MASRQNVAVARELSVCRCLYRPCEVVSAQSKRDRSDYESVIWIHLVTKEQQTDDSHMPRADYNAANKSIRE